MDSQFDIINSALVERHLPLIWMSQAQILEGHCGGGGCFGGGGPGGGDIECRTIPDLAQP